jgi:hypothetical protein
MNDISWEIGLVLLIILVDLAVSITLLAKLWKNKHLTDLGFLVSLAPSFLIMLLVLQMLNINSICEGLGCIGIGYPLLLIVIIILFQIISLIVISFLHKVKKVRLSKLLHNMNIGLVVLVAFLAIISGLFINPNSL